MLPLAGACLGRGDDGTPGSQLDAFGPLGEPDLRGVRVPTGYSARLVARSGTPPVAGGTFFWPDAPDGGAVFAAPGGGWVYVVNSEVAAGGGGVAALRFAADGTLIDAYPLLQGTSRNCAGGATPWSTWLSCEEVGNGRVWECDPFGVAAPQVRPALGVFNHEAVAVDPRRFQLYLTEDRPDGLLYRFTPDRMLSPLQPDLSSGVLEAAQVLGFGAGGVVWQPVTDPAAVSSETRFQVPNATRFNGGEGICEYRGTLYFTTKGDDRVWAYDPFDSALRLIYDAADHATPVLSGVDNITPGRDGTLYVAEDGGNLQIVALDPAGQAVPVVELVGHDASEVTGVAFDPLGSRLYFSSQRGRTGRSADGMTFEVRGPFPI